MNPAHRVGIQHSGAAADNRFAVLTNSPALHDARLTLIQSLWNDLQAARKDAVKYEAIAHRLRREADAFLRGSTPTEQSAKVEEKQPPHD